MYQRPIGFRPPNPWGMMQGPMGWAAQQVPAGAQPAAPMQGYAAAQPLTTSGGEPCFGSKDLDYLRDDLRGELEAITQYYAHIQGAKDPRVKQLLCQIMNDEKHHYAEVTALIRQLDAYQDQWFRRVEEEDHH